MSYEKPRFLIKHNERVVREIFEKVQQCTLNYIPCMNWINA